MKVFLIKHTSRLCVACLNMQLQPGRLGCQPPPPTSLRKFSRRWPEPSPTLSALSQLKQSSRNPSSPPFQPISLLKAEDWAHPPPSDNRRQTHFTACRQRMKRKDWRNTTSLSESTRSHSPGYISNFPLL